MLKFLEDRDLPQRRGRDPFGLHLQFGVFDGQAFTRLLVAALIDHAVVALACMGKEVPLMLSTLNRSPMTSPMQ